MWRTIVRWGTAPLLPPPAAALPRCCCPCCPAMHRRRNGGGDVGGGEWWGGKYGDEGVFVPKTGRRLHSEESRYNRMTA